MPYSSSSCTIVLFLFIFISLLFFFFFFVFFFSLFSGGAYVCLGATAVAASTNPLLTQIR